MPPADRYRTEAVQKKKSGPTGIEPRADDSAVDGLKGVLGIVFNAT
jgi:hypothetical protein